MEGKRTTASFLMELIRVTYLVGTRIKVVDVLAFARCYGMLTIGPTGV